MNVSEILTTRITYQNNYWTELAETSLKNIFDEIKGSKHFKFTTELSRLYSEGSFEMYAIKKKSLPVAAFSATFSRVRSKTGFNAYNYLIILDVDKLDSNDLELTRRIFENDPYIISCWKSPSQKGIKALVKVEYGRQIDHSVVDLYHKHAFNEISKYYWENHRIELDKSGSDFTRLCFISSDSEFYVKENFQVFKIDPAHIPASKEEKSRVMFVVDRPAKTMYSNIHDASGRNKAVQKKQIQNIISYLSKNSKSITLNYDDWLRVAFAIANSFTYDLGIKYFRELSKNDVGKYDPAHCENLLIDCYRNSRNLINFATIIHLAKAQGFVANRTNRKST